ncbi:MAG: selenocysteine-specific translation elongation factor [Alphaproteobacteria bacterium]|jgi:selenocysteine-specific elongation factor|nr:selenocysteine-specific translation elongation factor [Alphaproteobacteria bacterium]MDP6515138.1 selenocysteine-specific translation elongation factor [Alphaproteobacteria bacterium]
MIVATAGHVDHGKTLLVKALTGIDTDRLPEEKSRGLTIDLGFAYQAQDDGQVIGFVDVPGHERFVRNMLAGVSVIDLALLVVAADDGPMPQTIEHLAILDLLGIEAGLVALTKIDRVDDARAAQVAAEITALIAGTGLAGAEVFPVSSLTGDGIEPLAQHLGHLAGTIAARASGGNFRLAIDRAFTVTGAGLVVTGTIFSGTVAIGDSLMLSPGSMPVRVRGLHAQNRAAKSAGAGERCALNLAGADRGKEMVHRGDWVVAADANGPTDRLDARIRLLDSEPRALRHWTPAHLHLGAADVTCRVAVLEDKAIKLGESGRVQLVLDRPIGAVRGDRLILRDQSARRTMAGGAVIDPISPARGRARPARLAHLAAMETDRPDAALAALVAAAPEGLALEPFRLSWNLTAAEAEAVRGAVPMVLAGPVAVTPEHWRALEERIVRALQAWHEQTPDTLGPNEPELRRAMKWRGAPVLLTEALSRLTADGRVHRQGSVFHHPDHRIVLSGADKTLWAKIGPLLEAGGLRPPRVRELAEILQTTPEAIDAFMARARRHGLVVRVSKNRLFPHETVAALATIAESLVENAADDHFSAADFRDRSGIGRNLTIEVLEFFDRNGFTRRINGGRRILRPARDVFGG